MNKRLYKLMDWAFIEEVIYSECSRPQDLMGPHIKGNSTLLQTFFPGASEVAVEWYDYTDPENKKNFAQMEMADEEGFFAVLLPAKTVGTYTYTATFETPADEEHGTFKKLTLTTRDPYSFPSRLKKEQIDAFAAGNLENYREVFGAHYVTHAGCKGTSFIVWAPGALRVSVIGEFNSWDGRCHQMIRHGDSGIFEIFVPGAKPGDKYLYEIKLNRGQLLSRLDPACSVISLGDRKCNEVPAADEKKGSALKAKFTKGISVLQGDQDSLSQMLAAESDPSLIDAFVKKVKEDRFTHVQLRPLWYGGKVPGSFFAFDPAISREKLHLLTDALHSAGIGVIFSVNLSCFSRESAGLSGFDGSCLYEHLDARQGLSYDKSACLFRYELPQVRDLLNSAVFSLIEDFGADGLRFENVAQMLYLDYGKGDGEWVANLFGGNENLDAIDYLRDLMKRLRNRYPNLLRIAEDSSSHPKITAPASEDGLGFDLKLNLPFSENLLNFLSMDPLYRGRHLSELTNDIVYSFVDTYLLGTQEKGEALLEHFPGDPSEQLANLRLAIAYEYVHPGKKLLSYTGNEKAERMIADLNALYEKLPALYTADQDNTAFEWLSNMNTEQCFLSFLRKTADPEEMLMVVANFSGLGQSITTGVPYEGKYRELFNTDDLAYGGTGVRNKTIKRAGDIQADGRAQSVNIKMGPLSLAIFQFIPYTEEELAKVITERIRRNTPLKKKKKGSAK
ncbi:MAG: alpha amylase C-terminal domain-containing protein [Lachnospiraceae bacterium]|nr:alpha amylase C-terminal domain-containing protein [Lachnospiraceae bacterium]